MLLYPDINPIAISLGPVQIRWYGIMYVLGFAIAWALGSWRASKPGSGWTRAEVSDLIFYCVIGVIIGGRLGYILFYDIATLWQDPFYLVRIWQPGMSFHGGLVGVLCSILWFCHRTKHTFFEVSDFLAPLVPLGLGAGRIGNFINGELWGKPTDLPWGMIFSHVDMQPRHPSQLYEFVLEGLVLFVILWVFSMKPRPRKSVTGLFLLGYGLIRFGIEFARQPDAQLGYLAFGWVTMGQLLSLPMIIIGAWWFSSVFRK